MCFLWALHVCIICIIILYMYFNNYFNVLQIEESSAQFLYFCQKNTFALKNFCNTLTIHFEVLIVGLKYNYDIVEKLHFISKLLVILKCTMYVAINILPVLKHLLIISLAIKIYMYITFLMYLITTNA